MKYDYIIIGGGLGGLCSAIILAKEKKKVLVLEQHIKAGGYLHSFYRKGHRFETGFHFVPELAKDQILDMYWTYLGILDKIEIVPYRKDNFHTLIFPDFKIELPTGLDNLKEILIKNFCNEEKAIITYIDKLKELKRYFIYFNRNHKGDFDKEHASFEIGIKDFLNSIRASKKLQAIILAHSFLYGVPPKETPLGTHAIFSNALYSSIYDIKGGGDALVSALIKSLQENGGEILLKKRVVKIITENKKIKGIETDDKSFYETEGIISDINPQTTLKLFNDDIFRPAYTNRIYEMQNTFSHFGGYFVSKKNLNNYKADILYFPSYDIDSIYDNPVSDFNVNDFFLYITIPTSRIGLSQEKSIIETLSIDKWENYKKWHHTIFGKRDLDYYEFKEKILDKILRKSCEIIPQLKDSIEYKEGSTPLTNYHFTLSPEGSMYAIKHNLNQMRSPIRARTKLANFFFTGQSLIFPGIVGVTITAFVTCSDILGQDYLFKKIDEVIKN